MVRPGAAGADRAHQLQAVADGDVADRPALGRHDDGDLIPRGIGGRLPERLGVAQAGQCREPVGSRARASSATRGGRARRDQPAQAGPDNVAADQRQQPAAEGAMVMAGLHPRPVECSHRVDQLPPAGVPAASAPLAIQRSCQVSPGCCSSQSRTLTSPNRRRCLAVRVRQRERRAQQPCQHLSPFRSGAAATTRHRPRREPGGSSGPGRADRPGAPGPPAAAARRPVVPACAAITTRLCRTGRPASAATGGAGSASSAGSAAGTWPAARSSWQVSSALSMTSAAGHPGRSG